MKKLNLLEVYDNYLLNQPVKKPKRSIRTVGYWVAGIILVLFVLALLCYFLGISLPGVGTNSSSSISEVTQSIPEISASGKYYVVSVGDGNRLSFRSEPNEDATKLDRIDNGTRLLVTEVQNNWGLTTYNGRTGWVCIQNEDGTYCVLDQ